MSADDDSVYPQSMFSTDLVDIYFLNSTRKKHSSSELSDSDYGLFSFIFNVSFSCWVQKAGQLGSGRFMFDQMLVITRARFALRDI